MKPIQTAEQLQELLSEPTDQVVEAMRHLEGDIMLLGAGGKIGPSLALMAKRSSVLAGSKRRILAVSRFSNPKEEAMLQARGVETIRCDLLDETSVARLPLVPNLIFLAGLKFGSTQDAPGTWASNTWIPGVVCQKWSASRIVSFSTGTVYGLTPVAGGGSLETEAPQPVGEYAMSCLGRDRLFEYFSRDRKMLVSIIRLFYACELRYGVLVDLARKVVAGRPIDITMSCFNIIWQGDSNAFTLLAFNHAASPPFVINITGREILGIREVAETMGRQLGIKPVFCGTESGTACLGNVTKSEHLFGPPRVSAGDLIDAVTAWVKQGGECLDKPTHFETRDGRY